MKPILAACFAFLGGDAIWLWNTSRLYRRLLPPILLAQPVWWAAVAFYAIYLCGLIQFCLRPGLRETSVRAALRGAGFGFVAYATYDLTNQATVAGWPITITIMDLIWGTLLSAFACLIGCWVARHSHRP